MPVPAIRFINLTIQQTGKINLSPPTNIGNRSSANYSIANLRILKGFRPIVPIVRSMTILTLRKQPVLHPLQDWGYPMGAYR